MKVRIVGSIKPVEAWGEGLWLHEPDHDQWIDPDTGYPCLVIRNMSSGALNGYVAVPPEHPLWRKQYGEVDDTIHVHGGLTFSGELNDCFEDSDPAYWCFGFDCNHSLDFAPRMEKRLEEVVPERYRPRIPQSYKDMGYVRFEVQSLASQLSRIAHNDQSFEEGLALALKILARHKETTDG